MRYITIPEVPMLDGAPVALTFADFVEKNLLNHPIFGNSGLANIRAMCRIGEYVRSFVGEVWTLDEADWQLLKRACEEPGLGWPPMLARAIVGYFDAIVNAPTTDPRPHQEAVPS